MRARRLSHDSNTAAIARCSCHCGSARTSSTPCSAIARITAASKASNVSACGSALAAASSGTNDSATASPSTPRTMSQNMRQKRSHVSSAKLTLPVSRTIAIAPPAVMPRLSTVSIMPGMLTCAPERTDTNSGTASRAPKRRPVADSRWPMACRVCATIVSGSAPSARNAR